MQSIDQKANGSSCPKGTVVPVAQGLSLDRLKDRRPFLYLALSFASLFFRSSSCHLYSKPPMRATIHPRPGNRSNLRASCATLSVSRSQFFPLALLLKNFRSSVVSSPTISCMTLSRLESSLKCMMTSFPTGVFAPLIYLHISPSATSAFCRVAKLAY